MYSTEGGAGAPGKRAMPSFRAWLLAGMFLLCAAAAPAGAATADRYERMILEDPARLIALVRAELDAGEAPLEAARKRELLVQLGRAAIQTNRDAVLAEAMLRLDDAAIPHGAAMAHLLRAERLRGRAEHERALAEALRGAAALQAAPPPLRAYSDFVLCLAYLYTKRYPQAERHCTRAEAFHASAGDPYQQARVENIHAFIPYYQGRIDEAIPIAERAHRRALQAGAPALAMLVAGNLAQAYLDQGRHAEALAISEGALRAELAAGRHAHALESRANLARALSAMGRHREALDTIATAIAEAKRLKFELALAELYASQSRIAEAAGDLPLALQAARALITVREGSTAAPSPDALAELEARYASREQDMRIRALEQDKRGVQLKLAAAEVRAGRQRAWLAAAVLGIALAAALALGLARLLRRQHRVSDRFRRLSDHDPLTGLENRRAFTARLEAVFRDAPSEPRAWLLMILDLDHFKSVNDRYGHIVGDLMLVSTVAAMRGVLDPRCVLGRLGGEEFGMLCSGVSDEEARTLAERIRAVVARNRIESPDGPLGLTVSIGIAALRAGIDSPSQWLRCADEGLYQAKAEGRNRVVVAGQRPPDPVVSADA